MELLSLAAVFLVIIGILAAKRPLYQAVCGGLFAIAVLYRLSPPEMARRAASVLSTWSSLSVLLSLYLITFLQRILESRGQIRLTQADLDRIFHSRRVNTAGAPLFIGLLPSAASMLLCSDIVKDGADGYLNPKEQAFTASWFRHIPESTLPTYTGVLLMLNLSGVPVSRFLAGMIIPVITLFLIGYFRYLRRIPRIPEAAGQSFRLLDLFRLAGHLWSLLFILVLILGFGCSVISAVLLSILASVFVYRVGAGELKVMVRSAFEKKMLSNTFLVLALKEFLDGTGVLPLLPEAMGALPFPDCLVFALLFFIAAIISGTTGAIAMGTPLAFAAIPGGMPLMVYLMCVCHGASQLSPTHVCLTVTADYFHITLGELIRKTLPASLLFCALMTVYYNILILF